MADALDLQKRIDGLTVAPKDVVGGAADRGDIIVLSCEAGRGTTP
jgi:iron uptake system EfeUOB component EfeO/EfeM